MRLFACLLVKDEADILPINIRHLLAEGVDHIIVTDNGSTDATVAHLEDFVAHGAPLTILHDDDPGYYQSRRMTSMTHRAGAMGADFVLCIDADEIFYSQHGTLRDVLTASVDVVQWVEGFYHIPHKDDDQDEENPVRRMVHRRQGRDCPQSKVCFRYREDAVLHMGNHNVDMGGSRGQGLIAFREFQYRSFEHFARKVRNGKKAYDAAPEMHPLMGLHWRRLGAMSDDDLAVEWAAYLATPTEYDPAPLRTTDGRLDVVRMGVGAGT